MQRENAVAVSVPEKRPHAPGGGSAVCIWQHEYVALQELRRAQNGSPRFDMRDLVSAAIGLALELPDAANRLRARALQDFMRRQRDEERCVRGNAARETPIAGERTPQSFERPT